MDLAILQPERCIEGATLFRDESLENVTFSFGEHFTHLVRRNFALQDRLYRFKDESSMAVLPSAHQLAKKRAIRLSTLSKEPFVIFPRTAGASLFDEVIDSCRSSGFDPIVAHEAPQISSAANLVSAGLGVSIVPTSIAAQIQVKGVVYLPILGELPAFGLPLATRLNEKSIVIRNFQRLAAECREI